MTALRPDETGYELPAVTVRTDPVQLFAFSAVTWNLHRIHYDAPFATGAEQHESIVVHGPLLGAWILQVAESWVHGWGEVRSCHYRNVRPAYAGDELTLSGRVAAGPGSIAAEITVTRPDGIAVCRGEVTARPFAA
jgi:hydroxyacyl-ACP dehydratase HTD2-like protein with hotdog domain